MIDGNLLGTHDYGIFLISAIALNIVPGQDSLYIIGRSLAQGRRAGFVSVLGIGCGCLVHITAASIGLYALLDLWPPAYPVIVLAGAVYLVWLGVSPWLSGNGKGPGLVVPSGRDEYFVIFRQGFLTNLLNPKVALFFVAFLPSFVLPSETLGPLPFLFLGLTFFVTGTAWCFILAAGAGSFADLYRSDRRVQRVFSGVTSLLFIALGAGILLTHPAG